MARISDAVTSWWSGASLMLGSALFLAGTGFTPGGAGVLPEGCQQTERTGASTTVVIEGVSS